MPFEVGDVVEGTVLNITDFGAFIQLPEGKTGLVHISEVANTYVKDIREHLKEHDKVKVKILSMDANGRISLSIKKALPKKIIIIKKEIQRILYGRAIGIIILIVLLKRDCLSF